jgi:HAD superfamily phosphoserine phosphatase-like hydrolase
MLRGRLSHSTAKEALLQVHMQHRTRTEWEQEVKSFCQQLKPEYFNPEVLRRLHELQTEGAVVSIVSASIDIWLQPFADALQADLICTQSKWQNERWIGFASPNCRKEEKARRIQEAYDLSSFDRIVAFGNTSSDYAMLDLAHEGWLVRRGWPVAWR